MGTDFHDRSVVITGAAGGIGAALARRFAREGARLGLLDLELADAERVARRIRDDGGRARALACDVTSPESCRRSIDELAAAHDGIDVLVNNAGITHLSRFQDTDPGVIRRVLDVNFFGAVHATAAALDFLLEGQGRIVVLSSVAGFAPLARRTAYAASKHALHGFFDTLRSEHAGDGLGVTIVCPSWVDTSIGQHALDGQGRPSGDARAEARNPMTPDRLADIVVRAAAANRRLVVPSLEARFARLLSLAAPRLYERLMLRRVFPRGR